MFILERPKTGKRRWPRGDIDNFEKAIWDALTSKGYWVDDDQIVTSFSNKRYAVMGEQAGILICITEIQGCQ